MHTPNIHNITVKIAVIVIGSKRAGKSTAINDHLKPKLGIGRLAHKFQYNGMSGYILSQSLEEA